MTSRDDQDGQGRPQTIGKQSARAPKLQHDKNDGAKYIGKTNMGARGRRSDAEHFERHAAWERFFFKKMSATLHGNAFLHPDGPDGNSRIEHTVGAREYFGTSRKSDADHFERHAAWERFFFKIMSATLHGSGGAEVTPRCPKAARDPLPPDPQDN